MSGELANREEGPLRYVVRISERASRDMDTATVRYAEIIGEEFAVAWREGLYDALATIATFPRRCPYPPEKANFAGEVRQLIYRRHSSGVAYRIFFAPKDQSPDGPQVTIFHIRHGAMRPLTRQEARDIERDTL